MNTYAIVIEPISGFGTQIKGDTLFGHFCWEVAWDGTLVEGGLERQLALYDQKPFVIFSSAFPRLGRDNGRVVCALKRPALPPVMPPSEDYTTRIERYKERKREKEKRWVVFEYGPEPIDPTDLKRLSDQELSALYADQLGSYPDQLGSHSHYCLHGTLPHNTINRLSWTTGEPPFAPFNLPVTYYKPGLELVIFVLLNESATNIERVTEGVQRIGEFGFGRDASTGLGRFKLKEVIEIPTPKVAKANAFYTLAPCVPEENRFFNWFFEPFVRFGRHGGQLAKSKNPFKNPVVMADEGALLFPAEGVADERPYAGKAILGISKAQPGSVVQGYTPILPMIVRSQT